MTAGERDNQINELEILVFSAGGITFGVDTEQVGGVITETEAEALGMELVPFPDKVPSGGIQRRFQTLKALLIKDAMTFAVAIESPESILSIRLDSIRPLPPLLTACNPCQTVWGVTVREEGIILLIDFLGFHDVPNHNNNKQMAFSNKAEEATT